MEDDGTSDAALRKLANTAFTVLNALFCAYPECRTKDATREFLDTASSLEDSAILSKLRGWTADIRERLCPDGTSSITFTADEADGLRKHVDPYTTTNFGDFLPRWASDANHGP